MPPKSRRQSHSVSAIKKRWSSENHSSSDDSVYSMDISDDDEFNLNDLNFKDKMKISDIADIYELCKGYCNTRYLSVLIYLTLRHFNVSCRDTDAFLKMIGGKQGNSFYDVYPELEEEARAFAVIQCNQKAASFTPYELAQFIDKRYYEINDIQKTDTNLVRSIKSCRLDLRRWGARFDTNSNRPYFEGHDRPDVLEYRNKFIHYFLNNPVNYYTVSFDEHPTWKKPKSPKPTILMCHDESTFRSGDVRQRRWFIDNSAPFFSKGHGRSVMVSDFLVQHPSSPFFHLNEREWMKAVEHYPDLLNDNGIRYGKYSATAFAHLGVDAYFDNSVILLQFERLFKLLKFKEEYQHHNIEILVDNATTHTAKNYSINDFGKRSGTRCPVSSIEYLNDNDEMQILECYCQSGPKKGQSKGLLSIAMELGLPVAPNITLDELKLALSKQRAFQNVSKSQL
ncbi:unnamed protein product [Rotaria magnacalcarata]|uniref:Uncharacterized protein n=1 Tax=Rotaria magnacalcarata TaxID=392030 RepID=A0A820JI00_9BILA|nr:unnamed protein product [Rotaria magnacalcarata]